MESRSSNPEQVIEDFSPHYHHGRAQQEERPTAEAVLMTFSPQQSIAFVISHHRVLLTSPAGSARGWQPSSGHRGAVGPAGHAAGHVHLVAAGQVPRDGWGPPHWGERRAPPRYAALQRGPLPYCCCHLCHLEGKFPHCKHLTKRYQRLLSQLRCSAPRWGE